MPSTTVNQYEGLFLMSPAASGDLPGSLQFVREMLERAGADIQAVNKWDDRRLAYAIRGQKRALYILAVFRVAGVQIANIERDCNLSEQVIRVLMTRADHMGEAEIEAAKQVGERTQTEVKLRAPGAAGTPGDAEGADVPEEAEATA